MNIDWNTPLDAAARKRERDEADEAKIREAAFIELRDKLASASPGPTGTAGPHPLDVLALARLAAKRHRYTLAIHGSMARDLDLVAVPWAEDASEPRVLIEAIRQAVDGTIMVADDSPDYGREGYYGFDDASKHSPVERAHGRLAWSIYGVLGGAYMDVSVMPLRPGPTGTAGEPSERVEKLPFMGFRPTPGAPPTPWPGASPNKANDGAAAGGTAEPSAPDAISRRAVLDLLDLLETHPMGVGPAVDQVRIGVLALPAAAGKSPADGPTYYLGECPKHGPWSVRRECPQCAAPASPAVREAAELRLALRWALSKIGQPTRRVAGPLGNAEHFDAYQRVAALAAEGEPAGPTK